MLDIIDASKQQNLDRLRQKHDEGSKILSELSTRTDQLITIVHKKTEILRVLRKEYNKTERLIKNLSKETFVINEKCVALNQSFERLNSEIESIDRKRQQFSRTRAHVDDDIADMEIRNRQLTLSQDHDEPLEKEHEVLLSRVTEAREIRQTVSDEISEALSNSSLEREEIEPKLIAMNEQFLGAIDQRIVLQGRLGEIGTVTEKLEASVLEDEDQIAFLKAYKTLEEERDTIKDRVPGLKADLDADTATLGELKATRHRKQTENEKMSQTAQQKTEELKVLEEQVAGYQEILDRKKDAQEKKDRSSEHFQQQVSPLMELFTRRAELEILLRVVTERAKALKNVIDESEERPV